MTELQSSASAYGSSSGLTMSRVWSSATISVSFDEPVLPQLRLGGLEFRHLPGFGEQAEGDLEVVEVLGEPE